MVSKITTILELLGDGEWHGKEELLLRLEIDEQKFQEITTFLNKYDFVKIDEKNRKVKINKDLQRLLVQTII